MALCVECGVILVLCTTIGRGVCCVLSTPQSYHCHTPRKLAASKMDPSCTFGMYCKDLEDFRRFCDEAEKVHTHRPYTACRADTLGCPVRCSSPSCHWTLPACHPCVTGHCLHVTLVSLDTACMSPLCHWTLPACHPCVTGHCLHVTLVSLHTACTSPLCHWTLPARHPCVTGHCLHVTLVSLDTACMSP